MRPIDGDAPRGESPSHDFRRRGITAKLPPWYLPSCAAYDFVFAAVSLVLARELAVRAP